MSFLTFKFRLKDSNCKKKLETLAQSVNQVWNYCNAATYKQIKTYSKWLSENDLKTATAGCSKELGLNSVTIQAVVEEYKTKLVKAHKQKLRFRRSFGPKSKRSLGWIPFKSNSIKVIEDTVIYNGLKFRFWKSRDFEGVVKTGSFNQDSKGNWFLNLVCELKDKSMISKLEAKTAVGIDLGLKDIVTTSKGESYKNRKHYYQLEEKLGKAQRANKKKQAVNISKKIANQRRDYIHKLTSKLVSSYDILVVGDLHLRDSKSVLDAGFGMTKSFFKYKAIRQGRIYLQPNEAFTTMTCSKCNQRTGPKGLSGLSVRDWECSSCGSLHQRDVNAAINILNLGLGH